NKKIIAALLIAATLTGCDSLNNDAKDTEDTKVEEPTTDEATAKKEGEEDAEETGSAEGEKADEETAEDAEGEEEKASEAETDPGVTDKEKLEDAIFNNRVQARAAEILLEEAPDSLTEESKARLEQLVEDSTKLIEQAEALIDSL
ncbi:hypothetical protein, partial [uncultured Anaerococcus sp.]|uniref:hypothetical protein n=1 Tax=uncultured Anaerococcus sp. TaxID=293428 RepID=UPI0026390079